jgi:hypothetical protein
MMTVPQVYAGNKLAELGVKGNLSARKPPRMNAKGTAVNYCQIQYRLHNFCTMIR